MTDNRFKAHHLAIKKSWELGVGSLTDNCTKPSSPLLFFFRSVKKMGPSLPQFQAKTAIFQGYTILLMEGILHQLIGSSSDITLFAGFNTFQVGAGFLP